MTTFKFNQTVLPYARLGKSQTKNSKTYKNPQLNTNNNIVKCRKSAGNLYEAIIEEMGKQHIKYIKQLISKNKDNQNKDNKELHNHQRAKSYADIMVQNQLENPPNQQKSTELYLQSKINYEKNNSSVKKNKQMLSSSYQQTTSLFNKNKSFQKNKNNQIDFLSSIDRYLEKLCKNTSHQVYFPKYFQQKQTSKFNNLNVFLSKIQSQQKRIKQLKNQNDSLIIQQKQIMKKQKILKQKMYQMLNYIKIMNLQLDKQRAQKIQLHSMFIDFQQKINNKIKPSRKTTGFGQVYLKQSDMLSNDSEKKIFQDFDQILFNNTTYKSKYKKSNQNHKQTVKNYQMLTEDQIQKLFDCHQQLNQETIGHY